MKAPTNVTCHECAPKDWRKTPSFTGSYELDGVIERSQNGDLPARMRMYADMGDNKVYGPLTGYNGYSGYSGDN
jgi:hypothetical protein